MKGMEERNWKVACLTYNVNAQKAFAGHLYRLFDEEEFVKADFIAIGLQEVPHAELFGDAFLDTSWVTIICSWMYVNHKALLYKTSSATNILLLFARIEHFITVDRIDMRLARTTLMGLTGHKGSLSVRIKLKNGEGIVFINSHLVPHPEGYTKRCLQYEHGQVCTFADEQLPSTSYATVWLGDMNWRVDGLSPEEMNERLSNVKKDAELDALVNECDQLRRAKRRKEAFADFTEERIYFSPTYRLLVGTQDYDLLRVPSWCDRILYKGKSLQVEAYRPNQNILISDHFPVIGIFSYTLLGGSFLWNIKFEELPQWSSVVPVFCRFSFVDDFWNTDGAYLDWIGIFPEEIMDSAAPKNWLYLVACYKMVESDDSVFVAEFPCIVPGRYRFGYFSTKRNSLQGISDPFVVTE